ncbi:MAG: sulfatase [Spirochaetaceae bacterium]|nr:sulfatase [Spirochaetaceae bacterium]
MSDRLTLRTPRPPNVLWVFGDQHRAQATSYRGDPNVLTPNIDNLAREGMRFDAAVAGAPWCTPFRAALLTGRYPHQTGAVRTPSALPADIPTVAHAFEGAGYHTAYVGKWHLDGGNFPTHYVPPERRGGFRYWMGYENNNNQHECYVYGTDSEQPQRLPGYETDALSDLLIAHLRRHVDAAEEDRPRDRVMRQAGSDADKAAGLTPATAGPEYRPFFAVLSVQPPHGPNVTPTNPPYGAPRTHPAAIELRRNVPVIAGVERRARFDLAGYYAMIENLDYNIGRIRTALTDMGVDRDTYVVFFSDHGDMMGSHGQFGKSTPWEEAIRVPFIVHRAGGDYNMRVGGSDAPLNHVDIAPTSLGLCGIDAPVGMAGYDYSAHCIRSDAPEFRGDPRPETEPDSAYLQQIPPKLHRHTTSQPWRGVVTRDGWKYACTPGSDWMLFDTANDPYEQANYVFDAAYQEQKERCHRLLTDWIEATGDEFRLPNVALPSA